MLVSDKTEHFVKRARLLHGDKYDYSETVYVNSNVKLKLSLIHI